MKKKKITPTFRKGIGPESQYIREFSAFSKSLQNRIVYLRKCKALTQEQMQDFELNLRQYQRIEAGETKNMTLSTLFKIAKAFGVTLAELAGV